MTMAQRGEASSAATTATPPSLFLLLAAGAGLSAASLYYNQPILETIAQELGATPSGYATGIMLFAPLGDRLDLRRVILVKGAALSVVLLLAAFAPSLSALALVSLAIGLLATTAQDFVPAAAALARYGAPPAAWALQSPRSPRSSRRSRCSEAPSAAGRAAPRRRPRYH